MCLSPIEPEKELDKLIPLALELRDSHKYHEAISVFSQINRLNERIGKKYHYENAIALSMLGMLYENIGNYNRAWTFSVPCLAA
jgi:tetratricopeptide (TPR) repeat protein